MDDKIDEIYNEVDNNKSKRPKVFKGTIVIIVIGVILALIGVFLIGMVVGRVTTNSIAKNNPVMEEVFDYAKKYYYQDITQDDLKLLMAAGMISVLDPYTAIYPQNGIEEPHFGLSIANDEYNIKTVRHVMDTSPAFDIMKRGDIFLGMRYNEDEEYIDVYYLDNVAFKNKLNAKDTIQFKVLRDGKEVELPFITKATAISDSKTHYIKVDDEVGYIKLESFRESASDEMQASIYDFVQSGNNIMILDIRDNPGGRTDELGKIAHNFIEGNGKKNPVINIKTNHNNVGGITYAEYDEFSNGVISTDNNYIGDKVKKKTGKEFKLIVVANGDSASAAEAFIGDILHYMDADDYRIIGEDAKTYGKGIAQAVLPLKSAPGYELHLTTGFYYVLGTKGTPKENEDVNIHDRGYDLDNTGIVKEIKGNVLEESAIVKALEIASAWK